MIGEVRLFAGTFPPINWAFCEGQLLAISSNDALFSIIGTIYGGDGHTTFALPDLRSRVPVHPGTGPGLPPVQLGQQLGLESTTLTTSQLPAHNHPATLTVKATTTDANRDNPTNHIMAKDKGEATYLPAAANVDMAPGTVEATVGPIGGNLFFDNRQPSLALHYVICLYGTYPSRS